jgi:hypothetical protein
MALYETAMLSSASVISGTLYVAANATNENGHRGREPNNRHGGADAHGPGAAQQHGRQKLRRSVAQHWCFHGTESRRARYPQDMSMEKVLVARGKLIQTPEGL